ncbi:BTAD domain-containing putative transcriptional regulator [Nocardioides sp. BP30]|uniref:ATP-binding protein n=1 Tax=Nocardioides sp. BP30 TaxID=3036374 RepID=UPI00246985A8|nr:BTAD domain-containing putative transcriptional regulator [Nocardioides sp. BP30]WGL50500.1 BTAD domain-containing putative transcriptional regulator [Nocardioides sp. BP30]
MVRLRVLDEVTWDGNPVPGERTHALLRALVDAGGRGLGERALVEEVWADDAPVNPTKALQVVVSRARAATAAEVIERTPQGYRLTLAPAEVDAWSLRPDALRLAAEGRYAEALPLLDQLVRTEGHGEDEEVVEARLRAIAAVQGTAPALEAYEAYRERVADRLGIDPAPSLQDLHRELLARDAPVRAGLRFEVDEMIGREADVAALATLVRSHRVVSIVGAGGLGKTRLAHLMGRIAEQPIVHFVELVSVTSDDGVAVEVADALGARESVASRRTSPLSRADPISRIVDLVGTVPALLILDNCEQVVEGTADLVSALVARTPALTVLTTTRIPLGLAAERTYLLPELSTADAAALFVERAQAARPGAVLDPERVLALVSRLDGLPLAVELAAAKVRVMSVPEIERRLENRFALLRGGARDAPERHQTLLAVIDWSWNLLSESERFALRRLSVFRDGFSLEGASAVLAPDDGYGDDALDVLIALVEQSLVVVAEGETMRYRLLETVREFGRMQLVDAGDDLEANARLRDWAVSLCEDARRRLFSPAQVETMALLRGEEGNLVESLRRAVADEDVAAVATLLACLCGFWLVEGGHLKTLNLALPALPLLAGAPITPGTEDVLRTALTSILMTGRFFPGGVESVETALPRLRDLGTEGADARTRAAMLGLFALSDAPAGGELDALVALVDSEDSHVAQWAAIWASLNLENSGDLPRAVELAKRAQQLSDPDDGPWSTALVDAHLAGLMLQGGQREPAREHAERAIPAMAALGAVEDWAQSLATVALVAIAQGNLSEAESILEDLLDNERVQSVLGGGAISYLCGRAELLLARGDAEEGLAAYRAAVVRLNAIDLPEFSRGGSFAPWVLFPEAASLAAACRLGRHDESGAAREELLRKAILVLTEADEFLDYPIMGSVLFALASWELTGGDAQAGRRLLELAAAFSFNRMLPSLDPDWLLAILGSPVAAADVPRERLREEALAFLTQPR